VVAGHGISASAFGLGAARINGRMDQAYPLSAEILAFSWPLPDGTLLLPRLLSDTTDAPLVGEASILYNLTCLPHPGYAVIKGGSIPPLVYIVLALLLGRAFFLLRADFREVKEKKKSTAVPMVHLVLWGSLVAGFLAGMLSAHYLWALAFYVISRFFPLEISRRSFSKNRETEAAI
jgi:hypothetical protein